jgi:hypothetical protein
LEKQKLNQSNFANIFYVGFLSLNLDKDPSWHVMGDVNTFSTYNKNIDPIKIKSTKGAFTIKGTSQPKV